MILEKPTVKILKTGRFSVALLLLTVRPMVTGGFRVSRAPPRHTLPAFQNLHGRLFEATK